MTKIYQFLPILSLILFTGLVFRQYIFAGKLPIPADTIVGLYHPWRDTFSENYQSGVPFKNFQITDSVRQQFSWRKLSLEQIKRGEAPLWNPYSGAGEPLLANLQSAPFYPLNFLYFLPVTFATIWSWQIVLQLIFGGIFMWLFLRNFNLHPFAQTLGVFSWVGSGFFVAWLEWNTTVQVVIWLPLILLAIDKVFLTKKKLLWSVILALSLASSFFAGYLQPFFYVLVLSLIYFFFHLFQTKYWSALPRILLSYLLFLILVSPQLLATTQYTLLSAREIDQATWQRPDWFLPWQNLVQFLAPDYFGNPATGNYTGIWNYQEFVGYIGIAGFFFAVISLLFRRDKKTLFFIGILLGSLLFALPTPIAQIPFRFQVPFISTSQPSRLILITDFSLAVLAAFGLDQLIKSREKIHKLPFVVIAGIIISLWIIALKLGLNVAARNLVLPSTIFLAISTIYFLYKSVPRFRQILLGFLLLIAIFDLLRFADKFLPFSDPSFLYPPTAITNFLVDKAKKETFRVAALDDRIFPPNFSVAYQLQFISMYDPLYPRRYGEFISAVERNKPDILPPFGFNRIIVPKNFTNKLFGLLNVKYLLSFADITQDNYQLIATEGQTKLYENTTVLPRVFLASKVVVRKNKQQVIEEMYQTDFNPQNTAVIEKDPEKIITPVSGSATIKSYFENEILVETDANNDSFLVLTDQYYPSWQATIDNVPVKIFVTDLTFRGVFIPSGKHRVRFFLSSILPTLSR